MIRVALIGCGHHGRPCHAVPLARFAKAHPDRLQLAAACDMDLSRAQAACSDFGFANAYADIEQMLAQENLDACHCIVPPRFVPEVTSRLLQRQMPCVVEKPLGVDRAGLRQLLEAANSSRTPHLVSVNRRFMPLLNRGLQWARSQGRIEYIRSALMRHNRNEGCFAFSTGIHCVDAIRHIMGEVAAFTYNVQTSGSLTRDWQQIDFRFASGALGRLDVLPTTGWEEEMYELFGQGFYVRVISYMHRGTSVTCYLNNQLALRETSAQEPEDIFRGEYAEVEALVTALESRTPLRPTIADIAPSMEICLAIAEKLGLPTDM